jgi:hypothetical protein
MPYLLIGAYIFFSLTLAAVACRFDKEESPGMFWACVFFWPIMTPVILGFYLADKVKGNK